jgi:MraZ protein
MFIGEYSHNLDEKGRMAIPAKFRSMLKSGAVVTKGLDNCLFLYPKKQWEIEAKKIAGIPMNQSNARAYARNMLAGAMEVEFDSQGRVTLPEYHRQFAQLKKEAIVAGLYDKVEIWDKASWDSYKAMAEKNNTAIAEALNA